jgi:polyisoprenoid-binding protein YceI
MTTQTNGDLTSLVGTWRLNPERTSVSFRTRVAWLMRPEGTLRAMDGTAEVPADGHVTGEIVIDPASVDTKNKKRDDHLRSADFFDVANHPTIIFAVTEVRPTPSGNFEVVGNLAIHGHPTPLTLLAEVDLDGQSAKLSTEVVITKSMLGMKKMTPAKSWVTVHAHFDRAQP